MTRKGSKSYGVREMMQCTIIHTHTHYVMYEHIHTWCYLIKMINFRTRFPTLWIQRNIFHFLLLFPSLYFCHIMKLNKWMESALQKNGLHLEIIHRIVVQLWLVWERRRKIHCVTTAEFAAFISFYCPTIFAEII